MPPLRSTRDRSAALRALPQMNQLLTSREIGASLERHGRVVVAALLRERLGDLRVAVRRGALDGEGLAAAVAALPAWLEDAARRRATSGLMPVINATGVILHTNLGRAPLPAKTVGRVGEVAGSYTTLEYEIASGRRGSRASHLDRLAALLFPGQALMVVNNNAAAVLLALNSLAEGREVVVSRGELVEIGGSFRIPEIMAKSGAVLREVGTTNKTRLRDYERAISPRTGLLLKVHPSNYRIVGFTVDTPLQDLARLAHRRRLPLLMDQGSGNLLDLTPYGVRREPTVQEALRAGVDLVCCSGDKLLGGPQAGLLIGRKAVITRLKENPLARALRVDKMIYAALESVLMAHVQGTATSSVPVLSMIALSSAAIEKRARGLIERVQRRSGSDAGLSIVPGKSVVGGGSAPDEGLATALIAVRAPGLSARALEERFRGLPEPVVSRIERGLVVLDLRTVLESQETAIEAALVGILRR